MQDSERRERQHGEIDTVELYISFLKSFIFRGLLCDCIWAVAWPCISLVIHNSNSDGPVVRNIPWNISINVPWLTEWRSLRRCETARLSPNASMNKTSSRWTAIQRDFYRKQGIKNPSEVKLIVMLLITVKCKRLDRKEISWKVQFRQIFFCQDRLETSRLTACCLIASSWMLCILLGL